MMGPNAIPALAALWGSTVILFFLAGLTQAIVHLRSTGDLLWPWQTVALVSAIEIGAGLAIICIAFCVWAIRSLIGG